LTKSLRTVTQKALRIDPKKSGLPANPTKSKTLTPKNSPEGPPPPKKAEFPPRDTNPLPARATRKRPSSRNLRKSRPQLSQRKRKW